MPPSNAKDVNWARGVPALRAYLRTGAGRTEAGLVAFTVLALVVAGAASAVAAVPRGSGAAGPVPVAVPRSPSPSAPTTPPPDVPLPAAEDGGEVRVVESGFSRRPGPSEGDHLVTWGLVVENTSERTAASAQVDVAVVDEGGGSVLTGDREVESRVIPLVMPGSRAGIGGVEYVTGPQTADVTVTLDSVRWWPLDAHCFAPGCPEEDPEVARLTAGEVEVSLEEERRPLLIMQFRVGSELDHIVHGAAAQAIFRNEGGEIIGGTEPADTDPYATVPPGWSLQRIHAYYPPPTDTVDFDRTEVYVYAYCC